MSFDIRRKSGNRRSLFAERGRRQARGTNRVQPRLETLEERSLPSATPYLDAVLGDGPVSYYRLGESSGTTAIDSSGLGMNGTYNNGVVLGQPGALPHEGNTAAGFDGVDDHVSFVNLVGDSFTLEAWVQTTASSLTGTHAYEGNAILWSDVAGVANDWVLAVLNNHLAFFTGNPDVTIQGTTLLNDGQFHHVVATRILGGDMRIYVDGVLENFAPTNNERLDDNPTIVLGGNTLDSRYFNGVIDEAAVYDRALSDSEVLVHFLAGTDRLPTPEDDTRETSEGVPVEVRVLNNDSDPDNDPLTIVSFSTPANGSVSINDNETPDDATDDFLIYTPNVGFVGTDVFTYEVGDGRGGSASATVSVTVGASVPVVFAGGDAVLNEGDVFTRSGFFEDTGIGPWTATVDFGDGSGTQAVALNADHSFQFEHLFADSGSFNVFVAVTDEAGNVGSSSFVVTVNNVAPEAGVSGPAQGVRGQTLVFQVSASDVSPADQDAGFTYLVDWGDGSAVQRIEPSPGNGAGVGLEHVFTARGHYTVQVTAIDQDGDRSTTTHTVVVKAAALQADPLHPGKNMLVVGGTTGRDTIYLLPGANNRVKVVVNGVSLGSFRAQTRLVVFAQGGDDYVEVSSSISKSAWLFGDDGNDVLKGGSGRDVLVGGAGQDVLRGGWGRDLLIGGAGGDRLHGDARGDLILAGSVAFEANDAALAGVLAEWASGRDYQTRVANLRGQGSGPRLNGNFFLQVGGEFATVFDDGVRDCLTGGCGRDWFFAHLGRGVQDRLIDRGPGEAVDELL